MPAQLVVNGLCANPVTFSAEDQSLYKQAVDLLRKPSRFSGIAGIATFFGSKSGSADIIDKADKDEAPLPPCSGCVLTAGVFVNLESCPPSGPGTAENYSASRIGKADKALAHLLALFSEHDELLFKTVLGFGFGFDELIKLSSEDFSPLARSMSRLYEYQGCIAGKDSLDMICMGTLSGGHGGCRPMEDLFNIMHRRGVGEDRISSFRARLNEVDNDASATTTDAGAPYASISSAVRQTIYRNILDAVSNAGGHEDIRQWLNDFWPHLMQEDRKRSVRFVDDYAIKLWDLSRPDAFRVLVESIRPGRSVNILLTNKSTIDIHGKDGLWIYIGKPKYSRCSKNNLVFFEPVYDSMIAESERVYVPYIGDAYVSDSIDSIKKHFFNCLQKHGLHSCLGLVVNCAIANEMSSDCITLAARVRSGEVMEIGRPAEGCRGLAGSTAAEQINAHQVPMPSGDGAHTPNTHDANAANHRSLLDIICGFFRMLVCFLACCSCFGYFKDRGERDNERISRDNGDADMPNMTITTGTELSSVSVDGGPGPVRHR